MTDREYGPEELEDLIGHMNYIEQRHQAEFCHHSQQAKASEILSMLRNYIPEGQLQELEEFLGSGFGSELLIEIMQRERESSFERERREADEAASKAFMKTLLDKI